MEAINKLENSLTMGTYVKPTKITYKEYMLEQWIEDKLTRVKKQTLQTYSWLIEKHVLPHLGHVELTQLTPVMIQQLYSKLTKKKALSDENIQKVHTLINDSLKKAERWGQISKNPASLVDRPKATRKEVKVWDINQIKRFLKFTRRENRYHIIFQLCLTGGLRQGEALGLRFKDVDFSQNCIRITQTLSSDGKDLLPYTKTKSGSRTIHLPEETMDELAIHKARVENEKKILTQMNIMTLV